MSPRSRRRGGADMPCWPDARSARTFILRGKNPWDRMSAMGQKRTFTHLRPMSALPPKADIGTQPRNVRFVPKADIRLPCDDAPVPASRPSRELLDCRFGSHLDWKHYLKLCTTPGIRVSEDTTAVELNNHSRYRKPQSRSLVFRCNKRVKYFRRASLFDARPGIVHRDSDLTLILPFSLKR